MKGSFVKVSYERKRYWNEPTLTAWERAYLPEIMHGLAVTSTVFLRNMWRWVTGRKGALTTYYPEETRADYAPLNRGKHILTQRPDGKPQCIACNSQRVSRNSKAFEESCDGAER